MHEKKYKTVGYFDTYPLRGDIVLVKTKEGIFKARYDKYDWSDLLEEPYFQFKEGLDSEVLAWWPSDAR